LKTGFLRAIAAASPMLLLFAGAPSALAHAILVHSYPEDGSIVRSRDVNVVLDYDSRIDVRRCTITLTKAGVRIPLRIESSGKPGELKAGVSGLADGGYSIHWQVLASDGHITRGDVGFTVDVK
jgi:copper resistance protein C